MCDGFQRTNTCLPMRVAKTPYPGLSPDYRILMASMVPTIADCRWPFDRRSPFADRRLKQPSLFLALVVLFPPRDVVHTRAEQSDGPGPCLRLAEQRHRALRDLIWIARRDPRVRSGDGREIAVADFDRHGPRDQSVALEPPGVVPRHAVDLFAHAAEIGEVVCV